MDNPPDNTDLEFLISQYLDGQLEGRQFADFERRLAEDPLLAGELARYETLEGRLSAMSGGGLEKVDFQAQRASIMSALERKALLTPSRQRVLIFHPAFWGAVAAAASIVLAVFVGMKAWRPGTGPGPGPDSIVGPMVSSVIVPVSPPPRGEEIVQMAARQMGEELGPDVLPGPLPVNTVIVSCSPPAEDVQEQTDSPLMLFEL